MRVPRRLLVLGIVAALAVTVYIFWTPIQIRYRIWRTRAGDTTNPSRPHLCEIGEDAREPLMAAFADSGSEANMGNLRVVTANTLRCLRRERAAAVVHSDVGREIAYAELPLDDSVEAIALAFLREPDARRREQMRLWLDDIDFRARFRIYALLMAGPYPVPLHLPTTDPYDRYRGLPPEQLRRAWCADVAPVVRPILAGTSKRTLESTEIATAAAELMGDRCDPADIDLLLQVADGTSPLSTAALLALLNNADRQRIERVYAHRTPCPVVDRFYSALLQREEPLRKEAAALFDQVDIACLDRRCPGAVKDCRAYLHQRLLKP
jgi:hypothetical protein